MHMDSEQRELQLEAAAHVYVQAEIDRMVSENRLPELTSVEFIKSLHCGYYPDKPAKPLRLKCNGRETTMVPGAWRSRDEHNVVVCRHQPLRAATWASS